MKILQVIHGYPMRYNAGSEVYTQTLSQGLAGRHEVHVFTRCEDSFDVDFSLRRERDPDDARVTLHVVNVARSKDRYRHVQVDQRFAEVLDAVEPEVVHVGHLNHLSTSLVTEAAARELPVVFTLHDYWLMCPRGQFMQRHPEEPADLWAACDGQEDRQCAERCYARYFSGAPDEREEDVAHWSSWVRRRMAHVRQMADLVDVFVAPSRYLLERFRDGFGLPPGKLVFLDYGFDLARLSGRRRPAGEPFTFGYIGTHIPAKGIDQLIRAFGQVTGEARLRIWGRPRGHDTEHLRALSAALPEPQRDGIEWLAEYRNQDIVRDVLDRVDAIVVPSIWVENSPLVIHEALQTRVPVITADIGGMAEHVGHEVNGLLFAHRDPDASAVQMQRMVDDPDLARRLGARGYLHSESGDIPTASGQVEAIEAIYGRVLRRRDSAHVEPLPGPWRITFDTNPDTCNLHCVMCEEHSRLSHRQRERREAGLPRRVMPIELVRRVVGEAAPHGLREVIPSTMGEPLLHERFDDVLELCREHGVKLNLTTNGTFPRLGAREWARRIVPVTSDVKVSWNGASAATQERIMVGSNWERMLEGVRTFVEVRDAHAAAGGSRCRLTFQLTYLETNVPELADIVRLAIGLGVDRVKGHHVWKHFPETERLSMRRSADAIGRWNRAVEEARRVAANTPLASGEHILLDNLYPLDSGATEDLAPGGPCPFLGQEAWVSAAGRFDPCCAPDEQRKALGEFGNLHDQGFMETWTGAAYRRLVASYRNRPLCLGCNMRRPLEVS